MLTRGLHCWEPAETVALLSLGELVEEQRLLQELHLALHWALRWPLVLVEHWAVGVSSSIMGEGTGDPHPNLVEFLFFFLIISQFFWIQNLIQESGFCTNPSHEPNMDIDLGVLALL